ncbi:MAG: hypothetical protein JWQ40_1902 [Segetibacter sp.]|nr:hypothetical protein [Segetibacter sp.]
MIHFFGTGYISLINIVASHSVYRPVVWGAFFRADFKTEGYKHT